MNNNNFIEINTERLSLRKLNSADWEMIAYLRTDKEVNKFVKRPDAGSKEKALAFISKIEGGIKKGDMYYWSISENNNPGMIGSICLWNFPEGRKTAEIGYDLSPEFQGQGIMNEALKSILEFGFYNLNLESIEAYTHRDNESSKRLLERNGFKRITGKKDENNQDNIIYEIREQQFHVTEKVKDA
ncbi:GNAT family N-acetyltransferase [Sinomicrobium weinanense]|uniref:GNAT family N-acetyltransferase n=1 Tax=Sinomicrobium weinanense TaxID=2842200 RepID=A0A926JVR5_9FLAO|nr:GNAT family N-acetyltransferase [Sinomicrobium weinanense]MBC9798259.1 GNAT family N-acetyltransferase [Sinomicrobium weinanense]MBU3122636.1 GNAT family N-acetyltransferase [Sinomicrobium weinanense]